MRQTANRVHCWGIVGSGRLRVSQCRLSIVGLASDPDTVAIRQQTLAVGRGQRDADRIVSTSLLALGQLLGRSAQQTPALVYYNSLTWNMRRSFGSFGFQWITYPSMEAVSDGMPMRGSCLLLIRFHRIYLKPTACEAKGHFPSLGKFASF